MDPNLISLIGAVRDSEPVLVAVDGFAGAGKSTVTAWLAEAEIDRRVQVVSADEFYEPEQRDWRSWSPRQGYERYLDHQRLEHDVLKPLRGQQPARYQRYDWSHRQAGGLVEVQPTGVIIIEGVYLLRHRLRKYWDASIWVDAPRDVRERRLRERGEGDVGWIEGWMLAEDYYERVDRPHEHADYVVSGILRRPAATRCHQQDHPAGPRHRRHDRTLLGQMIMQKRARRMLARCR